MVRTYKKKNTHPEVNEADVEAALNAVVNDRMPLRKAAAVYGVKHTTLFYRIKKIKPKPNSENTTASTENTTASTDCEYSTKYSSKYTVNQVFTEEQEVLLEQYIVDSSNLNYGLTYKHIRKLAFEYAVHLNQCPNKWEQNQMAGVDWMKGFMRRHSSLSLRKPENTSLARTLGFNKQMVEEFQTNLADIYSKHKFQPDRIFNLDETGIKTVVQAPNVVARKGTKQVGQVVSGERGNLVTMCVAVNAAGNTVPPVFIFPRARMHDTLMVGSVAGSLGLVNSPTSGWITGVLFIKVLEHLVKFTQCSEKSPILLIMDNHESHCTLDAILFARSNGIVILTIPPHCSHRIQPLDVSILGPFKGQLAVVQNDWLINNPGKKISIHDLAAHASKAFDLAFTRKNITEGFKKCGIWPYSATVFTDDDFISLSTEMSRPRSRDSLVTDNVTPTNVSLEHSDPNEDDPQPCSSTSIRLNEQLHNPQILPKQQCYRPMLPNQKLNISPGPEAIRPLPTLSLVTLTKTGKISKREKGKSRVLTATPEKNRIEQEVARKSILKQQKIEKKILNEEKKAKRKLELPLSSKPIKQKKKKTMTKSKPRKFQSESSSESDYGISYMESDDSPYNENFSDSDLDLLDLKEKINPLLEHYYAVFYDLNWYIGRVIDFPDEGLVKVKFLKEGFVDLYEWPKHDDIQVIENKYIFYGPIKLIGSGPFQIDYKCKRRIILQYKSLKK